MKRKNRDALMSRTLKAMRDVQVPEMRYQLWLQAEGLLYEYKDLKVADVEAALQAAVVP